jgi:hypothetical protein
MRIRLATLDDVEGIVALHTAEERLGGGLYERYSKGGPWMAVETCAVHINNLLLDDQLVALAELNGTIVGEVEVLFSEERIAGRVRKIGTWTLSRFIPGTGAGESGDFYWSSLRRSPESERSRC